IETWFATNGCRPIYPLRTRRSANTTLARLRHNQTKTGERSPSAISPIAGQRTEGAAPDFVNSVSSNLVTIPLFARLYSYVQTSASSARLPPEIGRAHV